MTNKKYNLSLGSIRTKNKISKVVYEGQFYFTCRINNHPHLIDVVIIYKPRDNVVFDFDVMDRYLQDISNGRKAIREEVIDEIYSFVMEEISPAMLRVESYTAEKGVSDRMVAIDSRCQ